MNSRLLIKCPIYQIPVQHHFVCHRWDGGIPEPANLAQFTTYALIETTGRNIDILRLNLLLLTTALPGPFGGIPEKPDSHSTKRQVIMKVPLHTRSLRDSSSNTPLVSIAPAAALAHLSPSMPRKKPQVVTSNNHGQRRGFLRSRHNP